MTIRRQQTDDVSFVIKEPASGDFFRLGEVEHFIVQQFDGKTPLDVVRLRVEKQFEAVLSEQQLNAFVQQLEKRKFFEHEGQQSTTKKKPGRRISGSLLYVRMRAIDPTRLFDWIGPRLWFVFTPPFILTSTALMLFAAMVTIAHWSEFVADLYHLYHASAVPAIMLILFLVVAAHECAHGLTCKHFGGEVHELGFLLIYGQPGMYCNVSDAWLFPEKSKRLWVGFAGPYLDLFLWSLAVLIWLITDIETWIHDVALIIMASSMVKTFINLNPLIKLDGYYLLSDYLEIPNLRKRSFKYVGGLIKRCAGSSSQQTDEISPRERRIYFVYGSLATLGSLSLLVYVLITAGGYLVEGRQPTAVMISMGLLFLKLQRRYRRLFGQSSTSSSKSSDEFDDFEESDSSHVSPAAVDQNELNMRDTAKLRSVVSKRVEPITGKLRRSARPFIWPVAGCVVVVALLFGHGQLRVSGPFIVLPRENADVRASVEGIVEQVYVNEGDHVEEGDLIAKLVDRDLQAELQKTLSDVAAKRARLRMLVAGSRPEEIDLAKKQLETSTTKQQQALDLYRQAERSRTERFGLTATAINKADERLKFGEKALQMQQSLRDEGLGAVLQFDQAAEEVAVRRRELEEARAQQQVLLAEDLAEIRKEVAITEKEAKEAEAHLQLLLAGSRKEEIEAVQAEIKSSEAQQAFLQEQLDGTRVLSPAEGVVATSSRLLKEMNGKLVKKGDLIANVYEFKTVTAQILVSEKEIAPVRKGQRVELRARAYPNQSFEGVVTSIATSAGSGAPSGGEEPTPSSNGTEPQNVFVTTEIGNSLLLLKPEMTGQAKILCGPRRMLDLATRRASQTLKIDFWSWW